MTVSSTPFDFAAFKRAFETRDTERWAAFYAPAADWLEYRHDAPPRQPHVMRGREQIRRHLAGVARADLTITLSDEIISPERISFAVDITLRDGRRIYEHVILWIAGSVITRQVDIDAWD